MPAARKPAAEPEAGAVNKCHFCGKDFRRLTTLSAHLCEPKRRAQQENDRGVQIGYRSWVKFFDTNVSAARRRTYEDFSSSPYYSAFVKFGQYCVSIRAIDVEGFLDWLLKNNKKLDQWCRDSFYDEWLEGFLRRESVEDALARSLETMQEYAQDYPDLKNGFVDYFRYGNSNRIMHHITTGRVSPWAVYHSASGVDFLTALSDAQVALILNWIDPDYWNTLFRDRPEDAVWAKKILDQAGL